jgi:D-tyrosyl-tRNA(Tyr) deacylase
MRAVIQRVSQASVSVDQQEIGAIGPGILVLLAVHRDDRQEDLNWLVEKIINLRIFEDEQGKMNRSLIDTHGSMLVVSQFTLYGDCRKGRRPGYSMAAPPEKANSMYQQFITAVHNQGIPVASGQFQADMAIALVNDGPVTLLVDSASPL